MSKKKKYIKKKCSHCGQTYRVEDPQVLWRVDPGTTLSLPNGAQVLNNCNITIDVKVYDSGVVKIKKCVVGHKSDEPDSVKGTYYRVECNKKNKPVVSLYTCDG